MRNIILLSQYDYNNPLLTRNDFVLTINAPTYAHAELLAETIVSSFNVDQFDYPLCYHFAITAIAYDGGTTWKFDAAPNLWEDNQGYDTFDNPLGVQVFEGFTIGETPSTYTGQTMFTEDELLKFNWSVAQEVRDIQNRIDAIQHNDDLERAAGFNAAFNKR